MKLPAQFIDEMEKILPEEELPSFIESYERQPKKGIRTNTLKITPKALEEMLPEEFEATPVPWCKTGFYINHDSRPGKKPEYYTGLYYPQEPSAMIPGEVLDVKEGDRVLDLCAAPGGKSTQIAAKLGNSGILILNEIVRSRVGTLAQNVERMGIGNAVILNENPRNLFDNFRSYFDKILVDAPCSGEGMFRKDPGVIEEWNSERPEKCSIRQRKILETVNELLKPGGEIVYSTCTFSPVENEEVIDDFLKKYDYSLETIYLEGIVGSTLENIDVSDDILEKTVRIWPHLNEGEGHFAARLKKNEGIEETGHRRKRAVNTNLKKGRGKAIKDFSAFKDKYLRNFDTDNLYIYNRKLLKFPEGLYADDLSGLNVYSAGLELGELKTNRFEPSHALAMALKKEEFTNVYEMSEDELWDYLKGMEIKPEDELEPGWVLMCYRGYPAGFGKYSGRIKNKYPKGLRIYKK